MNSFFTTLGNQRSINNLQNRDHIIFHVLRRYPTPPGNSVLSSFYVLESYSHLCLLKNKMLVHKNVHLLIFFNSKQSMAILHFFISLILLFFLQSSWRQCDLIVNMFRQTWCGQNLYKIKRIIKRMWENLKLNLFISLRLNFIWSYSFLKFSCCDS